ncbi:MAG: hypothetical protein C0412_02055 [Flavobacterium sp.]|nr:hypothetical protein [Flavobacterium sp.]
MKRAKSIEALLKKSSSDYENLKREYELSLNEKHVSEELKVAIKNIFENLRSCLDYLAHDIFETHCSSAKEPDRLYFPIRVTSNEFIQTVTKDYPNLQSNSKSVYDIIEAIQPFHDLWLGQFNKLNNENKHQNLVEQTRKESRQVTVSSGGGSVSWGSGVTFGSGVNVMRVPIDPRTQMPIPNTITKTEVITWVDFRFSEIGQSVLPFIELSLKNVDKLFQDLKSLI